MNKVQGIAAIFIGMLATIATTNVRTVGAVTSGYKEPCSEGD